MKQIHDFRTAEIKKVGTGNLENMAWLSVNEGWDDKEWGYFQSIADGYKVNLVKIGSADELTDYLNTKDTSNSSNLSAVRLNDKITDFAVFAHGFRNMVTLGYDYSPNYNESLNVKTDHILKLSSLAFSNPNSDFYSCNTATAGADSFAAIWQNRVGGRTMAYARTSDYHFIIYPEGYSNKDPRYWGIGHNIRNAKKNYGFSSYGSYNYPAASRGVNVIIYE